MDQVMNDARMIGLRFPQSFQDFRGLQLPGVFLVCEIDCFKQCQSVEGSGLCFRGVPTIKPRHCRLVSFGARSLIHDVMTVEESRQSLDPVALTLCGWRRSTSLLDGFPPLLQEGG